MHICKDLPEMLPHITDFIQTSALYMVDVDECTTRINNCIEGSLCINTNGDFRCLCRGSNGMTDCTGMCKRRDVLIENGGWRIDNCINCTCLVSYNF